MGGIKICNFMTRKNYVVKFCDMMPRIYYITVHEYILRYQDCPLKGLCNKMIIWFSLLSPNDCSRILWKSPLKNVLQFFIKFVLKKLAIACSPFALINAIKRKQTTYFHAAMDKMTGNAILTTLVSHK